MKLHEKGSWFWWIIGIGMVSGWFGSGDDTKEAVVETAKFATSAIVEKVEKFAEEAEKEVSSSTDKSVEIDDGATTNLEVSHSEVARLKDIITSAIYESAVEELVAGNEVTLSKIWADVNLKVIDSHGEETAIKFIADEWPDDNTAIVRIGGEKSVINFDAEVGMVRNIEPFEESP
jgi:hypothetical protein